MCKRATQLVELAAEKSPARISRRLFAMNCSKKEVEMKILLVAINAKYIHSNLAVYCLKKYSKEYDNNIEIAEYTINQQNLYCRTFIREMQM